MFGFRASDLCMVVFFFFYCSTTCKYSGKKNEVPVFFVRLFVRWKTPFSERIAEYAFKTEFYGDGKCCLCHSENGIWE